MIKSELFWEWMETKGFGIETRTWLTIDNRKVIGAGQMLIGCMEEYIYEKHKTFITTEYLTDNQKHLFDNPNKITFIERRYNVLKEFIEVKDNG